MAILNPPLVRDPRSQTQFLARLHLFLDAAPSNVVCLPLALQCTSDTSFDKAHVLKPHATLFFSAEGVASPVGTLIRMVGCPSPSSVAPAAGPGVPNAACSLASAACSTFGDVLGLSSSVLDFPSTTILKVWLPRRTLRRCGSCQVLSRRLWISNSDSS